MRPACGSAPDGLVAAVVQDADDGRVLMVGWQDAEAIEATLRTGEVHFHSRSRGTPLAQGRDERQHPRGRSRSSSTATRTPCSSGPRPAGPTCHTGARSCFDEAPGRRALATPALTADAADTAPQGFAWLETLWATIVERAATAARGLLHEPTAGRWGRCGRSQGGRGGDRGGPGGQGRRGRRGCRSAERPREALAGELADLLYHALVLCAERGLPPESVIATLRERHGR